MNKTEYRNEYLFSDHWIELRNLKREMGCVGGGLYRCDVCFGSFVLPDVEVHHLTYARVGRERLCDLTLVCLDCHNDLERERKTQRKWDDVQKRIRTWAKAAGVVLRTSDDIIRVAKRMRLCR